jgi:hypothetical protein
MPHAVPGPDPPTPAAAAAAAASLGAEELSAAILATSLFNVTGLSVLTGFSAAMETLAGQAYGARAYRSVGVVLQRALLIVTLLTAALAALWTRSERLLLLAGQDAAIAGMAARYILRMLPALYCVGLSEAFKRCVAAAVLCTLRHHSTRGGCAPRPQQRLRLPPKPCRIMRGLAKHPFVPRAGLASLPPAAT